MDRAEAGLRAQTGEKPTGGYYTSSERITLQKFSLGRITTLPRSVFGGRVVNGGGGGGAAAGGGAGGGTGGGGGAIVVRPQTSLVDRAQTLQIQTNSESIGGLQQTLNSINEQLTQLTQGINGIAQQLQAESALEQNQLKQEQEAERRLAERQVRLGKESELERNIQAALARPIARLQQKVTSLFERIMGALTTLFFGWLTNQGIETLKALAEGDTEKLEEIKNNIIKNITYAVGAFAAVKIGFDLLLRTISRLSLRLLGLIGRIAASPFKLAADAVRRLLGLDKGKTPSPPGKPGKGPSPPPGPKGGPKGKGPGIFGAAWAAVESFMNFKNGEYVDAVMPIVATFGPGKFVKGLFAAGYAADQIAEIFGTNIFGKDPNKEKEAKQALEEESKSSTSSAQTQPTSKPQSSLMGDKKDDKKGSGVEATTGSIKSSDVKESPDSGVSVPPGTSGSSTSSVTPQTTKAPTSNALSLTGSNPSTPQMQGAETKDVSAKTESTTTPANITPAPTQPADVKAESLGPETKKPTTVIAQVPSAPPKQQAAPAPSAGTNTPSIRSSNPDNFYALYSQFNYNVVI